MFSSPLAFSVQFMFPAIANLRFAPSTRDTIHGLQSNRQFPSIDGLNDHQMVDVVAKFKSLGGVVFGGMPFWIAKVEADVLQSIAQFNDYILSLLPKDLRHSDEYSYWLKQGRKDYTVSASQTIFNRGSFTEANNEITRSGPHSMWLELLPDSGFRSYDDAVSSFFDLQLTTPPTAQIDKSRRQWVLSVIAELYPEKASDATFHTVLKSIFD